MKKFLISSLLSSLIVFGASEPSENYNYEITPFGGGILTDSKMGLDSNNYFNAGIAIGKNIDDSFINQVEIAYLRSDNLKYEKSMGNTNVNRLFVNAVKKFPLNEEVSAYGLAGLGYQDVTQEALKYEDSALFNYGVGLRYDIPYYGISIKGDVRHLVALQTSQNDIMYTLGIAMPLGKKEMNDVVAKVPVVQEEKIAEPTTQIVEKAIDLPKDDDNDGVFNKFDKCPNTSAGVKVNSDGCVETINLNINFDNNSAEIKSIYNERIQSFAKIMQENKSLTAVIEAHTDSKGTDSYNQNLSQKRANSVVNALKVYNIDSIRLKAVGYGETKPVATNTTTEGKAQNRRVEAVMTK